MAHTSEGSGTVEVDRLITESVDPRFHDLDVRGTRAIAEAMNAAESEVPEAVRSSLPAIADAIDAAADRMRDDGRLIYVGAGTPGRLAVLDAAECPPTFGVAPDRVVGLIAGGARAITEAVEGAEDDEAAGARDLREVDLAARDVVVGVSASGRTPYVAGALRYAGDVGALRVSLSCNAGSAISRLADHPLEIPVGPEVLSGSTRLKAGSAQKQVLNLFSTITMMRLGKVYGNLMVDLRATNSKLHARATRLVQTLTGVDGTTAWRLLEESRMHVPTAVLLHRGPMTLDEATRRLGDAGGSLRAALTGLEVDPPAPVRA